MNPKGVALLPLHGSSSDLLPVARFARKAGEKCPKIYAAAVHFRSGLSVDRGPLCWYQFSVAVLPFRVVN